MKDLTSENFEEETKSGKAVIDMWAEWCGPCKVFGPVFEETSRDYEDVKFLKLNVDEHNEVAGKFGVRSIPTILFLEDGEEVSRVVGALPKPAFKQKIDQAFG